MDKLNTPDVDVHDVRLKVQEMLIHMVNAQMRWGAQTTAFMLLRKKTENLSVRSNS
jgi:hypothetical protein